MKCLSLIVTLLFWSFYAVATVECNEWSNHGECVSGSSVDDANMAITKYYLHAYYIEGRVDFSYDINGKNYRVWLDKNPVFRYDNKPSRINWENCNVGRTACKGSSVSGGGACCYEVYAYFGVATECLKMDVR